MIEKIEYNAPAHVVMADVVECNQITDNGKMRGEVLRDLKQIFGSVSPFNRLAVFSAFLNELDKREIVYDKSKFNF